MSATIARLSRAAAHRQVTLWKSTLPWITPHYAVKCNDLSPLLKWLREEGVLFDCASPGEVCTVLDARVGAKASDILYANPCKSVEAIRTADSMGVARTVVDSLEEVEKLRDCTWSGDVLIRLAVPDGGSRHPFSSKFGAVLSECSGILKALCDSGLRFAGFSFHVGSECLTYQQYYDALQMCAKGADLAESLCGLRTQVVDVGGGFLWEEEAFQRAAIELERGRKHFFAYSSIEWLAEPGRFFAQPTLSIDVPVIAVRRGHRGISYTLNESIYGMFSCIPFDGQTPIFKGDHKGPLEACTLFGNTCDSADILGHTQLPPLKCGDILHISNIGAYSFVSSSNFNGFKKPDIKIIE